MWPLQCNHSLCRCVLNWISSNLWELHNMSLINYCRCGNTQPRDVNGKIGWLIVLSSEYSTGGKSIYLWCAAENLFINQKQQPNHWWHINLTNIVLLKILGLLCPQLQCRQWTIKPATSCVIRPAGVVNIGGSHDIWLCSDFPHTYIQMGSLHY